MRSRLLKRRLPRPSLKTVIIVIIAVILAVIAGAGFGYNQMRLGGTATIGRPGDPAIFQVR